MGADSYTAFVERFPEHLSNARSIGSDVKVSGIKQVVVAGVGGSAIAGDILQSYCAFKAPELPVLVSRGYDVPHIVDSNTLVFVISYSGNTEETLSAFRSAMRKGAKVVAITSGGKLLRKFEEEKLPFIKLPSGIQPRAALPYLFLPTINVLHRSGLIADPSPEKSHAISSLQSSAPSYREKARFLAEKLVGKVPLIYSSDRIAGVSYRWKTQFNENAKIHAFNHVFSEDNHNEPVWYTNLNANYYAIFLEDEADHRRIKDGIKLTKDIMGGSGVPSTHLVIRGEEPITRILSALYLGDLTSVYLARLTNVDPEPVEVIGEFKNRLGKVSYI